MSATVLNKLAKKTLETFGSIDTRISRRRKQNPDTVLAICNIRDDDAFIFGKTYRLKLLPSGRVAVKDKNGETVICDRADFIF